MPSAGELACGLSNLVPNLEDGFSGPHCPCPRQNWPGMFGNLMMTSFMRHWRPSKPKWPKEGRSQPSGLPKGNLKVPGGSGKGAPYGGEMDPSWEREWGCGKPSGSQKPLNSLQMLAILSAHLWPDWGWMSLTSTLSMVMSFVVSQVFIFSCTGRWLKHWSHSNVD